MPPSDQPSLPDILAPGLSVVFCGINPGASAAVAGHHFLGRGNRFWPVLHQAGFTPQQIIPSDDRSVLAFGLGLTTAVERATRRASDLESGEFKHAASALREKIERYQPLCIAFLGKAAYAGITRQNKLEWGDQRQTFGGARVWILPNPSGLNRGYSLEQLVAAYSELRRAVTAR